MNETQATKPWVVMVVDDDNMNLRRAEVVLKKQGYGVVKAASGKECLEQLKNMSVDLILLDILMPEMNGFESDYCAFCYAYRSSFAYFLCRIRR